MSEEIIRRLREELQLPAEWRQDRPWIDVEQLRSARWPRKLKPEQTVAVDPYVPEDGKRWVSPRWEILIANLDQIGYKVLATGLPVPGQRDEQLMRAASSLSVKMKLAQRVWMISRCRMWIGPDSLWRHVAAAVNVPQVIVCPQGEADGPVYEDTMVAVPSGKPAESETLGPLSVTVVADAVVQTLKKLGDRAER